MQNNHIFDQLRRIQDQHGFLPGGELEALSKRTGVPLHHLNGVADYYPHFHLSRPPKVSVKVCSDLACHMRGADPLRAGLKQRFKGTSEKDISVREVSCLGQCDGAPAISINDRICRNVGLVQAEEFVSTVLGGGTLPETQVETLQSQLSADPYQHAEQYGALRRLVESRDFEAVITQLEKAGLRGFGGVGFPTSIKWQAVRRAPGAEKFVVCNADESEPGTIKDRFILQNLPHLVMEGIIIAGLVTGAQRGILYIRHEYEAQVRVLEAELQRCQRERLIGLDLLGSGLSFELEIFVSPGGYICGEETALMEAIQGNRAEPRNRPPFPVTNGLWNKPTVLNNVETFANVPQILVKGVEWFRAQGQGDSVGLKFIGISGDVRKPGIYIIPMGLPVSELIFNHAGGIREGKGLKAFASSGPSSGYLPASMASVQLDFKPLAALGSILGSGAIVVCAEGTCMLDMALNAMTFFRNESCGKCVPCRLGTQKMVEILTGWTHGKGTPEDLQLVDDLCEAMKLTSICGLGQFAPSPITSVLKHFREEIETHIVEKRCPERVCPMT